jgi:integral membrane sensor domain MASE1
VNAQSLSGPVAAAQPVASARTRRREAAGAVVLFAVIAAVHAAGTGIVSDMNRVSASGEVFFPAAGVTVAALLLLPRRWWPVVLAAAFCSELAADLVLGETTATAVGSAVAGAAGPAAGAMMLLAWAGGPLSLSRRRQMVAFVAGPAVAGAGVCALIGAAAALFTWPHGPFVTVLARWWTGDVLGVLIVGGLVVAWLTEAAWPIRPRHRVMEGCALAACAGVLTWLAFWAWRPGLTYLCLVPLGWAAVRFGARGATTVAAVMAVAGEWGTVTDHGWLLALLAIGSLAILVGGRMAEQLRRVGILKAVGATPALVAGVLLAEYLALSFVAAVMGLVIGRLLAPLLTSPGAALLGTAGAPPLTASTVVIVVAVALAVAVLASFFPALRAARTSTVDALADAPRRPRRRAWAIKRSARLPVPLLLAVRLVARRPRRVVLCTLSIAVTVSGIVAVLFAHATLAASQLGESAGSANPNLFDVGFASKNARENQVLLVVTIMLVALAAMNAIFITRAMVQDSRHTCAVTRALGATPDQLAVALSAAQILPALLGAIVGIPGGFELYAFASQGGTSTQPSALLLIAAVLGTIIVVAGLTSIPARSGARIPVAEVLRSDT